MARIGGRAEVLLLIRLLGRRAVPITDLAERLGVERRAAYRLVEDVEATGLRVDRRQHGQEVYLRIRRDELFAWLWRRPLEYP